MPATEIRYKIIDGSTVRAGTARELLETIRAQGAVRNEEIRKMNTDEYVQALIEDAPYFIRQEVYKRLRDESFPTDYDRALVYLASSDSSQVRIIGQD